MKTFGFSLVLSAFIVFGVAIARAYKVYLVYDFPELLAIMMESATHPATIALGAFVIFFLGLWLSEKGTEVSASEQRNDT